MLVGSWQAICEGLLARGNAVGKRSVFDCGCSMATLVEELREQGGLSNCPTSIRLRNCQEARQGFGSRS